MSGPARGADLRLGLLCEQLLQPVPGGIGTYVRALLTALPQTGVEVVPIVAWHRRSRLEPMELGGARRVPLPRPVLHESWSRTGRPGVGRGLDLVHATSLAFPSPRSPLVVTVHDLLFLEFPDAYPARGLSFHRRCVDRLWTADLVISPSQATLDGLRSIARPPRRVRVVPLGTDLTAPREPEPVLRELGVERPYVLWVGTLEPRKNLERAIRGFVEAVGSGVRRGDGLRLYLVGPRGWDRGRVAELLEQRGVRELVRWLGPQPRERLAAVYAGAEAFVFPSLGEGFGLPVLEAMACGTPVVTSDRSALREVAGDAAVLCDPTDESSIAGALARLLGDPELAEACRRSGLRRAAEFTWERTVRETVACYREALVGAGG